ncbi:vacuolar import and degradation protein-domain-containing protein [Suillus tomentosus]|nr:vacuolar import and degradation protein-domain-containing protein [Suillus tomentosus]
MPVENTYSLITDQTPTEAAQATKYCLYCNNPLDSSNAVLMQDDHDSNTMCAWCRDMQPQGQQDNDAFADDDAGASFTRTTPTTVSGQLNSAPLGHIADLQGIFGHDMDLDDAPTPSSTISSLCPTISIPSFPHSTCSQSPIPVTPKPIHTHATTSSRPLSNQSRNNVSTDSHSLRINTSYSSPNPLLDITHIRVRSQGHHCLYPGAVFQGTQKSGRNSYEVNVNIVDVDFSSSFLCGYLRIRGLTDDWPELTTYFDAEIIGSRYGFLTQNWGANEQEDMVHWQRFPAFRHVKNELKKPDLTIPDRDRGAVFMRWKERFLVPNHRVQDINGASFAGFYYVCVDFNPQPPSSASALRPVTQSVPLEKDGINDSPLSHSPSLGKTETIPAVRKRRDSSVRRGGRGLSVGPRSHPPAATMSGFYFHQNSEPYQQLSLSHVPERFSSNFEFR